MRASKFFIATVKEAPNDAEIVSHKLMMRAGLIKRLGSGIYTLMPMGLRVVRKVEAIVREEMNRAGAIELSMPVVQPAELWQESGRWKQYGPELLRFKDRHDRDFVFQPTSEEVITDIARNELRSYRQLPVNFYQIQTKFRDERRPRFGIMRGREFTMKDAYSFHADFEDLKREYRNMFDAYTRIFTRLGLEFRAVAADTGAIGGTGSHEFHVLADSGEDAIAFCPDFRLCRQRRTGRGARARRAARRRGRNAMAKVATPNRKTCEEVWRMLGVPLSQRSRPSPWCTNPKPTCRRALFHAAAARRPQAERNQGQQDAGLAPFRFAGDAEIRDFVGCDPGYIGPVGLDAARGNHRRRPRGGGDERLRLRRQRGRLPPDRRKLGPRPARAQGSGGHPQRRGRRSSPGRQGPLEMCRGIEVGHIFQLRTQVFRGARAPALLDEDGKRTHLVMGCYGIGVSRVVGAAIEQGHDPRGIVFPAAIAPFTVAHRAHRHGAQRKRSRTPPSALYARALAAGIDVLLDDRDERPGVMFADMELIGIPHRVTIGERGLKEGKLEYQGRRDAQATQLAPGEVLALLQSKLGA